MELLIILGIAILVWYFVFYKRSEDSAAAGVKLEQESTTTVAATKEDVVTITSEPTKQTTLLIDELPVVNTETIKVSVPEKATPVAKKRTSTPARQEAVAKAKPKATPAKTKKKK